MLVSLIAVAYKDPVALELILEAMRRQTYTNFEIIVAEDNDDQETKEIIKKFSDLTIKHVFHPDNGRRKTTVQNRAICMAQGEYLLFIDGDCVPYSTFVEYHVVMATKNVVMSGRRANLDDKTSKQIREGKLAPEKLEKTYWLYYLQRIFSSDEHVEQGISLNPQGWIYKTFLKNRRRNAELLGAHIACYKEDIMKINGFNEEYAAYQGEDVDLNWRFKAAGIQILSCKNTALVFHLFHPKGPIIETTQKDPDMLLMEKEMKLNRFKCVHGLNQHC